MIRVAISQRICPDWRVPVFKELAARKGIDLTVYFGRGLPSGAQRNASKIGGFKHRQLLTIPLCLHDEGITKYRVFHPTLGLHFLIGNYDAAIVEPSTNFLNNLFLFPLCKMLGKKFIWFEAGRPETPSRYRNAIDPIVNMMIRGADAYITCNSYADECIANLGIGAERIFRAQNTLDTKALEHAAVRYAPDVERLKMKSGIKDAKVALFIGAIEKRKRLETLIAAALELKRERLNVKVMVVGDGAYEAELKRRLSAEERELTIFAGRHVDDAPLYILAVDIVVLPGQGGLSINHAFACGKPCVATTEAVAGGTSVYDYIRDGINGFVVKAGDANALAKTMKLIFNNKRLYRQLCQGAVRSAQELTIERMVDGMEKAVRYACRRPLDKRVGTTGCRERK